jgi:hypothetical protein
MHVARQVFEKNDGLIDIFVRSERINLINILKQILTWQVRM